MGQPSKDYELILEERPGYLYACVKAGTISHDIASDYWQEIVERCGEIGCKKLLLVRDIPFMLPVAAVFLLSERIQAMITGMRVAFINPYPEINERFDFGLMVGTNRGADYRRFDTIESAEKWLLEP